MKHTIGIIVLMSLVLSSCSPALPSPTSMPTQTTFPTIRTTSLPTPTSTLTPLPLATLTPTLIPTSTHIYPRVIFEEDFKTDSLKWKGSKNVVAYGDGKLSFNYPMNKDQKAKYYGSWTKPQKPLTIKGDASVQITFDQPVRFSGVFFDKPGVRYSFGVIVSYGEDVESWKTNTPSLGLLQPASKNPWDSLSGDITNAINKKDGEITFLIVFKDDEMRIYINDVFIATRSDKVFSGSKILGINDSNGDKFNVTEIIVWGPETDQVN